MQAAVDVKFIPGDDRFNEVISSLHEIMANVNAKVEKSEENPLFRQVLEPIEETKWNESESKEEGEEGPEENMPSTIEFKKSKQSMSHDDGMEELAYQGSVSYLKNFMMEKEKTTTKQYEDRAKALAAELESSRLELAALILEENDDEAKEAEAIAGESTNQKPLQIRMEFERAERRARALELEREILGLSLQDLVLDQSVEQNTKWRRVRGLLSRIGKDEEGRPRPPIEALKSLKLKGNSILGAIKNNRRSDQTCCDEEKRDEPDPPASSPDAYNRFSGLHEILIATKDIALPPSNKKVLKEFSERERPEGMQFQDAILEEALRSKQAKEDVELQEKPNTKCGDVPTSGQSIQSSKPVKRFSEQEYPDNVKLQDEMLQRAIYSRRRRWIQSLRARASRASSS